MAKRVNQGLTKAEKIRLKESRRLALAAGHSGVLFTRDDRPADFLRGAFVDEAVFLVCGGPSASRMDLTPLDQRGVIIAAVNQAAAIKRPHLWFTVDPQTQFSAAIWRDPGVMKFTKRKYLGRNIHEWTGSGYTEALGAQPRKLSNCWGFEHCDFGGCPWNPATFLTQALPPWGSEKPETDPEGKNWHKSVMLATLWLLHYLGFRRVYLLGCDFLQKTKEPYGFDEAITEAKAAGNNRLFEWLDRRFAELQPHFRDRGFTVHNCTPGGRLTAFPRLAFEEAVQIETSRLPVLQTRGHYRL